MNILVITFYKGNNPGTFMQAFGVQTALKKAFPNSKIEFLNCPDYKKELRAHIKSNSSILSIFIQKLFSLLRQIRYYYLINKTFDITSYSLDLFDYNEDEVTKLFSNYDLISIGSDTILEKVKNQEGKIGLNWGAAFIKKKKIFFAASAAPANFKLMDNDIELINENLNSFSFIGIRDLLTVSLFTNEIGILPSKVIKQPDPTYFLDVNMFELPKNISRILRSKRKIALFNFNSFFPYRKELARLLRNEGYTLVSSAMYNSDADISLGFLNAFEWAAVFRYCDIVVTERFHDSLFALRNIKAVFAIDWDETRFSNNKDSKTYRLMEDYQLLNHHFNVRCKDDLLQVISQIKKSEEYFEKSTIKQLNDSYIQKAESCLNKIIDANQASK